MAARFNNCLPSGKFGKIETERRGTLEKLIEGLHTWKTRRIASRDKENETFEEAKNIAMTRSATVRLYSVVFHPTFKRSCEFNTFKIRQNDKERKIYRRAAELST